MKLLLVLAYETDGLDSLVDHEAIADEALAMFPEIARPHVNLTHIDKATVLILDSRRKKKRVRG